MYILHQKSKFNFQKLKSQRIDKYINHIMNPFRHFTSPLQGLTNPHKPINPLLPSFPFLPSTKTKQTDSPPRHPTTPHTPKPPHPPKSIHIPPFQSNTSLPNPETLIIKHSRVVVGAPTRSQRGKVRRAPEQSETYLGPSVET